MRNQKNRKQALLIIMTFIFGMLLNSCSSPHIYFPDREWKFSLKSSDRLDTDTVFFKTYDESWQITQTKCEWIMFQKRPEGAIVTITTSTGIIDRKENLFMKEQILFPALTSSTEYFYLTRMIPPPKVYYPISKGQVIDWESTPHAGWGQLEGKTARGTIKTGDKIYYSNSAVSDSCWVLDAVGESEYGKFRAKYYFSETYGFIYFHYDFNDYQIEIVLLDMNFAATDSNSLVPDVSRYLKIKK
ncbi:MAG: hypothetical protein KAH48_11865 [Chlorobi bacterium]|nr:hypothetical protein [Chlorobiota bacterium]